MGADKISHLREITGMRRGVLLFTLIACVVVAAHAVQEDKVGEDRPIDLHEGAPTGLDSWTDAAAHRGRCHGAAK